MNKQDFIAELRKGLHGMPKKDIEERLAFYSEIIDDRMEEGLSEEEAISEMGKSDEVISQIISEIPLSKIVKENIKPKRKLSAFAIVLLAIGSPIWIFLMAAALAVIIAVYAVLWVLVVCLWAIFAAFAVCGVGCTVGGAGIALTGNTYIGAAAIGGGAVCAGLAIFMFFACRAATKGAAVLTKKIALCVKKCFVRKEEA